MGSHSPGPFREAHLKIERAKKHVTDLNRTIGEFRRSANYTLFIERDVETGENLLKVTVGDPLSDKLSPIIGDAIHNLRTALDYAVNEIEFLTVGRRSPYTKFPIYDSRGRFEAAINGAFKKKAPKQVIDYIESIVQPYRGGNGDPLWCLHELDIRDKHQLLIANVELVEISGVRLKDHRSVEHPLLPMRAVNVRENAWPIFGITNPEITDQGYRAFRITFGQGLPCGSTEITPTLCHLLEIVTVTLEGIKERLSGN